MLESLLTAAAARVERAWCQGVAARTATGDPRGFYGAPDAEFFCLRAAIHVEAPDDMTRDLLIPAAERLVRAVLLDHWGWHGGLGDWNDMPGRRQHEVVQALRVAAARVATTERRLAVFA